MCQNVDGFHHGSCCFFRLIEWNHVQFCGAYHIGSSYLICSGNQMTGFYTKPQHSKKVCMNFVALYYFLMSINGYNNFKLFLRIVSVVKIYLITTFQFLPLFFQFSSCSPRKIFWMCNPIWNSLTLNEFFILHGFYAPSQKLHHPKNLSNIFKFFARNVYEDLIFWYQNYLPAEVKCKNVWSKQVISFYCILQNLSLQISDSQTYRTQSNI